MASATGTGGSERGGAAPGQAAAPPPDEAPEVMAPDAPGPALILCEHAANHIPARYSGLGLAPGAEDSHAAWDPGARAVALRLAQALKSPLVAARVSRLVYDCNRPPEADSAIPTRVERIDVPGNRDLDAAARAERAAAVYAPFSDAVEGLIARRRTTGRPTALITVHSFSSTWFGAPRATEIGILHDADTRLADAMLARADTLAHRTIDRNEPYGPADGVTHSLCRYGLAHDLPNVMIEIRNDLLAGEAGCARLADEVLTLLRPALEAVLPAVEQAGAGRRGGGDA